MAIRKVKTSSGNTAVQIGYYEGKTFHLAKHIGTAKDEKELKVLYKKAYDFLHEGQLTLFDMPFNAEDIIPIGYKRIEIYKSLSEAYRTIFPNNNNPILRDLVIARIIQPSSKLESLEFLFENFGIKYSRSSVQRSLLTLQKEDLVISLIDYAIKNLSFKFSLVFYDVTTLYFESQKSDELKRPGFSKDGKHTNPQIMIGLVVDSHGFPITYEIFKGNSFEGHTMLPILLDLKKTFNIKDLTVVADSAMLSESNLLLLESNQFSYIVGNKTLSTYNLTLNESINKLKQSDNSSMKIRLGQRFVIYHYSQKREKKDLFEIQKALQKAEYLSLNPARRSKSKYLTIKNESSFVNQELVQKHMFLAGIKSYKTNIDLPSNLIIERYSDLWKIEKAFRMSKHDLKARPIFHRKEDSIKAHIQIVFAANAVAKQIELETGLSIKEFVKDKFRIIDFSFKHKDSSQIFSLQFKPH